MLTRLKHQFFVVLISSIAIIKIVFFTADFPLKLTRSDASVAANISRWIQNHCNDSASRDIIPDMIDLEMTLNSCLKEEQQKNVVNLNSKNGLVMENLLHDSAVLISAKICVIHDIALLNSSFHALQMCNVTNCAIIVASLHCDIPPANLLTCLCCRNLTQEVLNLVLLHFSLNKSHVKIHSVHDNVPNHIPVKREAHHQLTSNSSKSPTLPSSDDSASNCTSQLDPNLSALSVSPHQNFTPKFNSSVYEYYTQVSYDIYRLFISAETKNCLTEARFHHKNGLSRPFNATLGLGVTEIKIHVVDVTHTDPWVLNTYKLKIHRLDRGTNSYKNLSQFEACDLIQECGMQFTETHDCGLLPTGKMWKEAGDREPSICRRNGDQEGRWQVPCMSCHKDSTCVWNLAEWVPYNCRYRDIATKDLQQCFKGKQVLFIGDSTNRGIMHHMIERINGSLHHWHKSHSYHSYQNINSAQTNVSFAYYPRFWVPQATRPVFDKTLHHLLSSAHSLDNSKSTILVVGGLQWMSKHHINVIRVALKKANLDKITVIIKTLGAGFHQGTDKHDTPSRQDQRKLLSHNRQLIHYSKMHGYKVMDTFNMTTSRYKDFLQGQCACHFHKIKEKLQLKMAMNSSSDVPIKYHVEGNINAQYSKILFHIIC